jgi:hypothetical protein
MKKRNWLVFTAAAIATAALALTLVPPPQEAEAQPVPFHSYAAKFVCGWNPSNIGFLSPTAAPRGEATVKVGNYATEINIYNPQQRDQEIKKRILVLYRSDDVFPPIGREPKVIPDTGGEVIVLPVFHATMDDCNQLYQLAGIPVVNPPILIIGYLVIQSPQELDVTSVYTAELCSDKGVGGGPANLCNNVLGTNYSVSLSIDVEQVEGKLIQ